MNRVSGNSLEVVDATHSGLPLRTQLVTVTTMNSSDLFPRSAFTQVVGFVALALLPAIAIGQEQAGTATSVVYETAQDIAYREGQEGEQQVL